MTYSRSRACSLANRYSNFVGVVSGESSWLSSLCIPFPVCAVGGSSQEKHTYKKKEVIVLKLLSARDTLEFFSDS